MASSLAQHRAIRTWNRAKTVTDKDGNPSISTVNQGTETLTTSRALMAPTGTAVKVVTRSPTTTIHTVTFPTPRTVTIILAVYLEESFVTLRGAQGTPTATRTTHVPLNKIPWTTMSEARSAFVTFCPAVTVTDSNGVPVATLKAPGSEPRHFDLNAPLRNASSIPRFDPISSREYILAAFTPTIVTLPLTILAQILSSSLKATWPFHALTQPPPGATASDSVALTTGGFSGVLTWLRLALHRGDFLLLLADALNLLCAGAVAFSTEAFGIRLLGSCTASDFSGCHMGIAIFRAPGRLVQVFLSLGLAILAVLATLLWNWNSGMTGAEGRRIASIAALLTDPETRKIFRHNKPNDKLHGSLKNKEIVESLAGYSSSIQKSASVITSAEGCYIAVYKLSEESPKTTTKKPSSQFKFKFNSKFSLPKMAFPRLRLSGETVGRILYFLSLIAFLILIVYYELTSHEGTPFEDFMNSQNLGVRALFAGLGVAASLFWDHCFSTTTSKEPYRLLSLWQSHMMARRKHKPHKHKKPLINLRHKIFHKSPATSVFSTSTSTTTAATSSIIPLTHLACVSQKTTRNSYLIPAVAFTTLLSKITPLPCLAAGQRAIQSVADAQDPPSLRVVRRGDFRGNGRDAGLSLLLCSVSLFAC